MSADLDKKVGGLGGRDSSPTPGDGSPGGAGKSGFDGRAPCGLLAVQPRARAFVSAAHARRPLSPGDLSYC